jgi:hypothetical protein
VQGSKLKDRTCNLAFTSNWYVNHFTEFPIKIDDIEPRIQTAVPIIGLPFPTFEKYLKARANGLGMEWTAPLIPPSMVPFFERSRAEGHGVFGGKKILTIHGGEDRLVPYDQGEVDITRIQNEVEEGDGVMKVQVMQGLGHVVTVDMVKMTAEWIWKYCLTNRV